MVSSLEAFAYTPDCGGDDQGIIQLDRSIQKFVNELVMCAYAAQHYHWSYAFRGNNDFQKYIIYIILCWSVGPISEAPPTRAEGTAQPLAVA